MKRVGSSGGDGGSSRTSPNIDTGRVVVVWIVFFVLVYILSSKLGIRVDSNFHREGKESVVDVKVGLFSSQGRGVPPVVLGSR
jgi:hypothetical protein